MPTTPHIPNTKDAPTQQIPQGIDPKSDTKNWSFSGKYALLFFLIFFIALGVRLIHITGESVWWDEFATVAFLTPPQSYIDSPEYGRWNQQVVRHSSPSLKAFLEQNRQVDPAAMPLYLSMEYYWNKYVSPSIISLRLLSVLISMLAIVLLFFTGRKLFNTHAGLIAMLCISLSPIHVQFAKEIRMYGLMTLFAVALIYVFYHLFQNGGKRWWILYAAVALLLSWTHPFALLLPFTLGVFWLTTSPKDMRRLILWSMVNACVLLPAAVYVLSIQFWGEDSTDNWMHLPNISELFADLLADDAIGMTYQVNATPSAWEILLSSTRALKIISWRWVIGRMMIAGALSAIIWLFVVAFLRNAQQKRTPYNPKPKGTLQQTYLLVLWLIVPPLVLYGISIFWRPCIMPRYTVHCSMALYLLVGGALSLIPIRVLKITAITLLCLFYGYQQMLMAGEAQHPDWYGARNHIRKEAISNDLILVHNGLWKRVFAYNMKPIANDIGYGSSYDILAEQCAFRLLLTPLESPTKSEKSPTVWVVIRTDYFEKGTITAFENELEIRNLCYTYREFGGIQHVLVYRIQPSGELPPTINPHLDFSGEAAKEFSILALDCWRDGKYTTAVKFSDYAIQIDPKYARAWAYKGMAYKELGKREEALEALERAVAIDRLDYPWSHINIAMLLVELKRYEEAINAALRALEVLPNDAWAHAMLGQAHLGLGEKEKALVSLRQAASLNTNDLRIRQILKEAETAVGIQRGDHE